VAKRTSTSAKKDKKNKGSIHDVQRLNIWKERKRRVFENKQGSPTDVLHEIKMEVQTRKMACGGPEIS